MLQSGKIKILTVIRVLSIVIAIESLMMLLSLFVGFLFAEDNCLPLLLSALITLSIAITFYLTSRLKQMAVNKYNGYLIVALIWIVMPLFGTLPYVIGGYIPSFTNAFFESMSGFTTTGSTILTKIDMPASILFFRSMTQWVGGVGIVVIVISFISFIDGGSMALFTAETVGPDKGKMTPRMSKNGKIIINLYLILTATCTIAYFLGGMSIFDAICHSFTTVSSGGFSTQVGSASAYSPLLQYLMIIFMIPSGINFIFLYFIGKGQFSKLRTSEELKTYFILMAVSTILIFVCLYSTSKTTEQAFRESFFQAVSMTTTTGYTNADHRLWTTPVLFITFLLMFVGGMSGSTSGGVKVVRLIVLVKNAKNIIKQKIHNNAFMPIKLDKQIVPDGVLYNILVVFILYIAVFVVAVLLLALTGLNMEQALQGCLSCLNCAGPIFLSDGLSSFAQMPDVAKWIFSILMYLFSTPSANRS
jgi:trk system potassium uptake protein TrkH